MSKEIPNSVKSVGTRPGTTYRLCKVHKQDLDGCPPRLGRFYRPYIVPLVTLLPFKFLYKIP